MGYTAPARGQGRAVMANDTDIRDALVGRRCTALTYFGLNSWRFDFEEQTRLDVRCPWRIVANDRIALGNVDHEQQFGLPKPIDAIHEVSSLLKGRVVMATVRKGTADLVIEFANRTFLEVFNSSSGYEGWECSSKNGLLAIALGGGEIQTFHTDPPVL